MSNTTCKLSLRWKSKDVWVVPLLIHFLLIQPTKTRGSFSLECITCPTCFQFEIRKWDAIKGVLIFKPFQQHIFWDVLESQRIRERIKSEHVHVQDNICHLYIYIYIKYNKSEERKGKQSKANQNKKSCNVIVSEIPCRSGKLTHHLHQEQEQQQQRSTLWLAKHKPIILFIKSDTGDWGLHVTPITHFVATLVL